jgi:hypothetical protein
MRRKAVETLEARKNAMISGFWANDGLNDEKGSRQQALDDLEAQFTRATNMILSGETVQKDDQLTKEDEENPFLAPAIKATREIEMPRDAEGTVKGALESEGYDPNALDQTS